MRKFSPYHIVLYFLVLAASLQAREVYLFNDPIDDVTLHSINDGLNIVWENPGKQIKPGYFSQHQYAEGLENVSLIFDAKKIVNATVNLFYTNRIGEKYIYEFPKSLYHTGKHKLCVSVAEFKLITPKNPDVLETVRQGDEILTFGFGFSGAQALVRANVTDAMVYTSTGEKYRLFDVSVMLDPFGKTHIYSEKVKKAFVNDGKPRVYVAGGGHMVCEPFLSEFLKMARDWPGVFGVDCNENLFPAQKKGISILNNAGVKTVFEGHKTLPYFTPHISYLGEVLTRFDGYPQKKDKYFWSHAKWGLEDVTSEKTLEMTQAKIAAAFDVGFSEYWLIDYVWAWDGGRWGYGANQIKAFVRDLKSIDDGIYLANEQGEYVKSNFWDYLALFTDVTFKPSDLGLKTWDAYRPVTESQAAKGKHADQRNLYLFTALYHYEYLKFLQKLGDFANSKGGVFGPTVNAEDIFNAVDLYVLGLLRGVDKIGYEYFGSPAGTYAWYHNMYWYASTIQCNGKAISLIAEINAGGHGATRYSHEAAYAFYYDITSVAKPIDYNNQYLELPIWTEVAKDDEYHFSRYAHWTAGALAFLQSHKERSQLQPAKETVVVASRGILEYQNGFADTMGQIGNIAALLDLLHYPFDSCGKERFSDFARDAKNLIYCPARSSTMHINKIKQWLSHGKGRTLVLHAFAPFKIFDGRTVLGASVTSAFWEPNKSYARFASKRELEKSPKKSTFISKLIKIEKNKSISLESNGRTISSKKDVYYIENGKVILSSKEGVPLVSEIEAYNNRVLYVHVDISATNSVVNQAIAKFVMSRLGVEPEADAPSTVAVHSYDIEGGKSCVLWHKPTIARQIHKNYYDRKILSRSIEIEIPVFPNKNYSIYDYYQNISFVQNSGPQGKLIFEQTGSCDIFYYGEKDSADFAGTMKQVCETRTKLNKFAPVEYRPVLSLEEIRKKANPNSKYLVFSASMDSDCISKSDGVMLNFKYKPKDSSEFVPFAKYLNNSAAPTPLMAISLDSFPAEKIMLQITCNGNTSFDTNSLNELKIMDGSGKVIQDLLPQISNPDFCYGLAIGKKLNENKKLLSKYNAVWHFDGKSLVTHPAWNGISAPLFAVFDVIQNGFTGAGK